MDDVQLQKSGPKIELGRKIPRGELQDIPMESIDPSEFQMRGNFDPEKIQELAQTTMEQGLHYPIRVRRRDGRYQLIGGHRRWLACKELGWQTIPAFVTELSDEEAVLQMIAENDQREDLNPIERAHQYKRLMEPPFNYLQTQIAARVGKSKSAISRALETLNQPQEIQDLVAQGKLSERALRDLDKFQDPQERIEVARRAASEDWTSLDVGRHARKALSKVGSRPKKSAGSPSETPSLVQMILHRVVPWILNLLRAVLAGAAVGRLLTRLGLKSDHPKKIDSGDTKERTEPPSVV